MAINISETQVRSTVSWEDHFKSENKFVVHILYQVPFKHREKINDNL